MNKIVMAKTNDSKEILNLYKSQLGREFCVWDEDYPTEDEIKYDLDRDALFIMKNEEGKIISAISLDEDSNVNELTCWSEALNPGGELSRLAVAIEYQNQGIAQEMIRFGMQKWKEKNYKSVRFLVNKYNTKALRSYSHLNFQNVGECFLYEQEYFCFEKAI